MKWDNLPYLCGCCCLKTPAAHDVLLRIAPQGQRITLTGAWCANFLKSIKICNGTRCQRGDFVTYPQVMTDSFHF
jgi:hypothetical protein